MGNAKRLNPKVVQGETQRLKRSSNSDSIVVITVTAVYRSDRREKNVTASWPHAFSQPVSEMEGSGRCCWTGTRRGTFHLAVSNAQRIAAEQRKLNRLGLVLSLDDVVRSALHVHVFLSPVYIVVLSPVCAAVWRTPALSVRDTGTSGRP